MKTDAEFLVIGAGIIGSFATYFLSKGGKEVICIDKKFPSSGASGANAGTLTLQNKPNHIAYHYLKGTEIWKYMSEKENLDIEFHQSGGYLVAESEEAALHLRNIKSQMSSFGIEIEYLTQKELLEVAPYLSPHLVAANYCPLDGSCNARLAGREILNLACRNGAKFYRDTEAIDIEYNSKYVNVLTDNKNFRVKKVLIAAGLWSQKLLKLLGVDVDLDIKINQLHVTEPLPDMLPVILTHTEGNLTLKQVKDGTFIIGGGWQGKSISNYEEQIIDVSYDSMIGNCKQAARIFPPLSKANILRMWVRYEGKTKDRIPLLGKLPLFDNIYVAISGYGGFHSGPALGLEIVDSMINVSGTRYFHARI